MSWRIVLILSAATLSGCFDFDGAYSQFCDAGRCSGPTGGGTSTGGGGGETGGGGGAVTGGGGGGVTGGGGGATGGGGGGVTGGGGGATGGGGGTGVDAGCQDFLCPALDWTSPQSGNAFQYFAMAPGLNVQSLDRFNLYASFQGASSTSHIEFRFANGVPNTIFRFTTFRAARDLRGVSLTDQWFNFNGYAQHIVGGAPAVELSGCSLPDGGLTNPSHRATFPVSADEAWVVGYPMSVCHWTSDGGFAQTAELAGGDNVYLTDVYRAPSGQVYVVGGNYLNSVGTCVIADDRGARLGHPVIVDDSYQDGCNSIDGVGGQVYVVARDDSTGHGRILGLQPDGGFDSIYTASFPLSRLDALPSGEVWAVGYAAGNAVYFDGGAWGEVTLPLTENRFNVEWENVQGTGEGIVLSGFEQQLDGGYAAVVNVYRRLGK